MYDVDVRWKSVPEQLFDREIEHKLRYLPHAIVAAAALVAAGLTTVVVVDTVRGGDMIQMCTTYAQGVQHCQ